MHQPPDNRHGSGLGELVNPEDRLVGPCVRPVEATSSQGDVALGEVEEGRFREVPICDAHGDGLLLDIEPLDSKSIRTL